MSLERRVGWVSIKRRIWGPETGMGGVWEPSIDGCWRVGDISEPD